MLDYDEPDSVLKFSTEDVSFCLIYYVPVDIVVVLKVAVLELVLKVVFEVVLEELIEVVVIIEL